MITVKATKLGFYSDSRRYEGDVFQIESMKQFSKVWMELVEPEEAAPSKPKPKKKKDDSEPFGGSAVKRSVI